MPVCIGVQGHGAPSTEGIFLLCALRAVYACHVSADGKLSFLHTVAAPPDVREGCLPYAAWLPASLASGAAPSVPSMLCARLAVAWDRRVLLLDVPLRPSATVRTDVRTDGGADREGDRRARCVPPSVQTSA
jgi:hypothetical protein